MSTPRLHLASASPRRSEILTALGLTFSVVAVDVNERRLDGEPADAMVLRLAQAKVMAAPVTGSAIVVGADTAVALDEDVFGKPSDCNEALRMLRSLSGRTHKVLTGIAVRSQRRVKTALSETEVRFREIGPDEALAYWHSGEPCDKAGAYAIQGRGGAFVEAISGSYSGVVGLPVFETVQLLNDAGISVLTK